MRFITKQNKIIDFEKIKLKRIKFPISLNDVKDEIFLLVLSIFIPFSFLFGLNNQFLNYAFVFLFTAVFLLKFTKKYLSLDFEISLPQSLMFYTPLLILFLSFISFIIHEGYAWSFFANLTLTDSLLFILSSTLLFVALVVSNWDNVKLVNKAFLISFYLTLFLSVLIFAWNYRLDFSIFGGVKEFLVTLLIVSVLSILSIRQNDSYLIKALKSIPIILSIFALAVINVYELWVLYFVTYLILSIISYDKKHVFKASFVFSIIPLLVSAVYLILGKLLQVPIKFVYIAPSLFDVYNLLAAEYSYSFIYKLFGLGPASFAFAWQLFKPSINYNLGSLWNVDFYTAPNLILQYLVDFGLLAGTSLFVLILVIFIYLFKFLFNGTYAKRLTTDAFHTYIVLLILAISFLFNSASLATSILFVFYLAAFINKLRTKSLLKDRILQLKNKLHRMIFASPFIVVALILLFTATTTTISFAMTQAANRIVNNNHELARSIIDLQATVSPIKDSAQLVKVQFYQNEIINTIKEASKNKENKLIKSQVLILYDEIIKALKSATEYSPRNYKNWIDLSSAYIAHYEFSNDKAKYDKAKKAIDKAKELAPWNPVVYKQYAKLYSYNKEALQDVKTNLIIALNLNPQDAVVYGNLWTLLVTEKNIDAAIVLSKEMMRFYGADPRLILDLAQAYLLKQDYTTANQYLNALIQNNYLNPQILSLWANVQINLGKENELRKYLNKLQDSENPYIKKMAKDLLDELNNLKLKQKLEEKIKGDADNVKLEG